MLYKFLISMIRLTAADSNDNFDMISVVKDLLPELAARNNFAIAFYGNAFSLQRQSIDELNDGERRFKLLRLSVNDQLYHERRGDIPCR